MIMIDTIPAAPGPTRRVPGAILFGLRRDPLAFLMRMVRQYGDVVHFQVGPQHFYLLNHPDYIKEVLVTQDHSFMKGEALQRTKRLLGEGLLTSEGELHRHQRRIIQPLFHRMKLSHYGSIMTEYAGQTIRRWQDGDIMDISAEMSRLTLLIAGKTLFGVDMNEAAGDVGKALTSLVNTFNLLVLPFSNLLERLPLPSIVRAKRAQSNLDSILYRVIQDARSSPNQNTLISVLLEAQDEDGKRMNDRQIRDEAMTLFLAGHETTSNALTWTWYLLSQHPEAESKLETELDSVLGGRLPTVEDIPHLPYTQMVLSESMRLYPPAWVIGRRALQEVVIGNYLIPAGSIVAMSQYVMHRDPRFYFDPERFDPERWTPEAAAQRPNYSYFPFGGGSRLCIGKHFALMEGVLLLATIAQPWKIRLAPRHRVRTQPAITLRAKNGLRMSVHRYST